ncbi:uncharacterized protein BP5553_00456 [Venustampulla echinocandica]|uniref:Inositol polyphosphate-related phosphatase domain-containing protein n=1 Tax=Venustampulla echinocandica TaxID=2656787 RepID=A0A370TY72_9HELO|nr:uncharacterized protein BP5553_00456 [Venustampulla echinocandica]RDL40477.1 hypothetical protein BP5553_00456 [Venustampulla echinocandica]
MASSARTSTEDRPGAQDQGPTVSNPHSLSKTVHARRAEYTRPQKIKIKIGSWNVAACPNTELDLAGWFVQGKGVDERLSGAGVSSHGSEDEEVESAGAQEAGRTKEEGTIPKDDKGVIPGGDEIGLYVLGLQEVVDLSSAREYVGRVYTDTGPMAKWRKALSDALPAGYVLITEEQLSGLLLLVFASPTVAPTVSSVSTVSVGTGIMGYLGNKGAVTTRILLGETTRMVFVNSHLASGSDPAHLDRRCWDVAQILQRTRFDPINFAGVLEDTQDGIGDEDFAFWFGDLNFRLDGLPGDDIRRLLMLHTKGEYGVGEDSRNKIDDELGEGRDPIVIRSVESDDESEEDSDPPTSGSFDPGDDSSSNTLPDPDDFVQDPSQDPASLQATLDSLLPHDQLRHMQKKKKAFHDGWREGPITFLPTYKYDVGSMGIFDSSEKKRAPSWCDRILYRTRKDKLEYEGKAQEDALARIKDEEMKARGIDQASEDEDVLFDYNPDEDGLEEPATNNEYDEYNEEEADHPDDVLTKEGYVDRVHLYAYTSHQRVLSSDHKPLDAAFTVEYDAVVPELKARIHQEVARELDRAENEGRPGITVVVDRSHEADNNSQPDAPGSRPPSVSIPDCIDFGKVAYLQRKTRSLTIANTSQVPATFFFADKPSITGEEDSIAPSWLSVYFVNPEMDAGTPTLEQAKKEVTLEPGDAINVSLDVFVDDISLVRSLNAGEMHLDDVLILRVTDGRDHFIPVRGTWLQSCFGRSVDELIRIPQGGVRALPPPRRGSSGAPVNNQQEVYWSAPRELFKLTEAVEALVERVVADSNMIESSQVPKDAAGWPFDCASWTFNDSKAREVQKGSVLDALDADKNINDSFPVETPALQKLEIISEVLIGFLNSLTDGIVPAPLWDKLEADMVSRGANPLTDTEEIKTWVLDVLSTSPNHNISFVFLTSMLSRVAGELAPVPKVSWRNSKAGSVRSSMETVRRSLSWKGKAPLPPPADPNVLRREAVERAYADVFRDVVYRGPVGLKDKERKAMGERRREVLEPFVGDVRTSP